MVGDKVQKIRVAYTGAAVNDGSMDVNELSGALIALSNLVGSANRILNNDKSTVDVRLSADVEHGSFEITLEIVRTISEQIRNFFGGENYSLGEILGTLGLVATLTGYNLLEIYRLIKGRKIDKVESSDDNTVKITIADESHNISIGAWKLYQSQKIRQHMEGVIHPLTKDGIDGFEVRDFETRQSIERVEKSELNNFSQVEESVEEINSTQTLVLQIVSVSFEQNLKWRFFDGESKFYATIADKEFLKEVETGRLSFANGDSIIAEVETRQQYTCAALKKAEKSITKVLKILKPEK